MASIRSQSEDHVTLALSTGADAPLLRIERQKILLLNSDEECVVQFAPEVAQALALTALALDANEVLDILERAGRVGIQWRDTMGVDSDQVAISFL